MYLPIEPQLPIYIWNDIISKLIGSKDRPNADYKISNESF